MQLALSHIFILLFLELFSGAVGDSSYQSQQLWSACYYCFGHYFSVIDLVNWYGLIKIWRNVTFLFIQV